jgi:8-oxo-dGTP pyrophosphatase MutT (NUDIX family)
MDGSPGPPPVPPRNAATVLLLRDTAGGVEVFLLRRTRAMAFAAGMTVFPGGAVDRRDADADLGWVGPPPATWTSALSADEPLARALVCAAVRETFEESGVLLAGPTAAEVCAVDGPDWEADRAAVEAGTLSLAGLLARRGLLLRADLLRPWAHWITPEAEARRYDTRFLVAALPSGQSTREVTSEADTVQWLRPADALTEHGRGRRTMLPPTVVTLGEIAGYRTVGEILAAAPSRTVSPIQPRLVGRDGDRLRLALPDGREFSVPAAAGGAQVPPADPEDEAGGGGAGVRPGVPPAGGSR